MAIYDIATGNDDRYYSSTAGWIYTTTTIYASHNTIIFPAITEIAYGDIDTSGIPTGDTISAATLYLYLDSYTASRGVAKTYTIWMLSADESTWSAIHNGTFSSAGWLAIPLTASELLEIDKGSGQKTNIKITVPDVGASQARTFQVRAYEYATTDSWDMYLDVTHAPPSTAVPTRTLLGVGL